MTFIICSQKSCTAHWCGTKLRTPIGPLSPNFIVALKFGAEPNCSGPGFIATLKLGGRGAFLQWFQVEVRFGYPRASEPAADPWFRYRGLQGGGNYFLHLPLRNMTEFRTFYHLRGLNIPSNFPRITFRTDGCPPLPPALERGGKG